ncbi:MAG TPA: D-aminoacylase [Oscillospiraceae bacterium]|nr:D-aminoacylase [Oscillospiraceae bacterium]
MSTLIKNVMLIDGSGQREKYAADIVINGDRIERIDDSCKQDASSGSFKLIIDGSGLYASPGFIDTHAHSDVMVFDDPCLPAKSLQGITCEFAGQDGTAVAPLPEEYIDSWRKYLSGIDGDSENFDWHFHTLENYREAVRQARPAVNMCIMAPHGNLRLCAMGYDPSAPSAKNLSRMKELLRQDLKNGGFGLTTGLDYIPSIYADTAELADLCSLLPEYDGVFAIHLRSEANEILEAIEEVIEICRSSGCRGHISHFKVAGEWNFYKLDRMIELLDEAKDEGLAISFDQYPYPFGSTTLTVVLPPWAVEGGADKMLSRLESQELRARMKHDMQHGLPGWTGFCRSTGTDNLLISSVEAAENFDALGKSLDEIADLRQSDPFTVAMDLIYSEKGSISIITKYGKEEHIGRLMLRPEMNLCTDGLFSAHPHPRTYGSFPRFFGKYVREEGLLSWEEAVYKTTGKAAELFRLQERGFLQEGYYADIVLLNPESINDCATLENPQQYPVGIEYVFVNGELTVERGVHTGRRPGRVLMRDIS